jgi:hypothetical protein
MTFDLNRGIAWSLTGAALTAIEELQERHGFDADFALAVLEDLWPTEAIYGNLRGGEDSDNVEERDSQYGND